MDEAHSPFRLFRFTSFSSYSVLSRTGVAGDAEPFLDELPDIGSLVIHFSADSEVWQRTDSPVALQGFDAYFEQQAQVLIIQ